METIYTKIQDSSKAPQDSSKAPQDSINPFYFTNNKKYIKIITHIELANLIEEDYETIIVISIDSVDQIYDVYLEYGLKYYHFLIDEEYYIAPLHVNGIIDRDAIGMLNAQLCGEIDIIHTSIGSKPMPNSDLHHQYVWGSNNEWLEWCSSEQKNWVTKASLHLLIVKLNKDCLYIQKKIFFNFMKCIKLRGIKIMKCIKLRGIQILIGREYLQNIKVSQ